MRASACMPTGRRCPTPTGSPATSTRPSTSCSSSVDDPTFASGSFRKILRKGEAKASNMETRTTAAGDGEARRFRLCEGEPVPAGLQRIAGNQLEMSLERLEGDTDEDLGTAVHETRKSLKRLRATVRLARHEL